MVSPLLGLTRQQWQGSINISPLAGLPRNVGFGERCEVLSSFRDVRLHRLRTIHELTRKTDYDSCVFVDRLNGRAKPGKGNISLAA
jgi:hypothetical protein